MIPLIGSPPPAAEAKLRAALRLFGEALIEWSAFAPAGPKIEERAVTVEPPAVIPSTRHVARSASETRVWTADHDRLLREAAGTAPAQRVAEQLGVSLSTLYKHSNRLKVSLAVVRREGELAQPSEALPSEPAVVAPVPVPTGDQHDKDGQPTADLDPSPLAQEQAVALAYAPPPAPEDIEPVTEAAPEATAVKPVEHLLGGNPAAGKGPTAQHVPLPAPETPATVQKAPVKERRTPAARKAAAQPAKAAPTKASPKAPTRALIVTRPERDTRDIGVLPRGDIPTPNRRSPTIGVSRAASSAAWFRLRHPDGRWLRIDCLGWVADRRDSYLGQMKLLENVRARFPLASECAVVPEPAWHARDIEFSRVTR